MPGSVDKFEGLKDLPLAVLRDEQRHFTVVREPLETIGIGVAEGLKQSLYIGPAI